MNPLQITVLLSLLSDLRSASCVQKHQPRKQIEKVSEGKKNCMNIFSSHTTDVVKVNIILTYFLIKL